MKCACNPGVVTLNHRPKARVLPTERSLNFAPMKPALPTPQPVPAVPMADIASYTLLLEQAEVCCEQAREAARLKRFRSALGLFATASALCRHVECNGDDAQIVLAKQRLSELSHESATYGELARGARRSPR